MLNRLHEILETAIALSGADFGNIQLLGRDGVLKIIAERGFSDKWLQYWETVSTLQGSCGKALGDAERIIVPDVRKSLIFTKDDSLDIQLNENVHAVQSTPIFSRNGQILGIFSTHYKKPVVFEPKDFLIIDALVKHAADVIDFHKEKQLILDGQRVQSEYTKYLENKVKRIPIQDFKS